MTAVACKEKYAHTVATAKPGTTMRASLPLLYRKTAFLAGPLRCLAIVLSAFMQVQLTAGAAPALETPRFIQAQNIGNGTALSMATTPGDGFVVVGAFSGTATFGPSNVTAGDSLDVFVACYGAQSNLLWLNTAGGNQLPRPSWSRPDEANAVALDSSGNIFVVGYIVSPALFGATSISGSGSSGDPSLFLAKYDLSGALLWVRSSESTGSQVPDAYQVSESLAVDSSGNAYIAGRFTGILKLGTTTLTAGADGNLFVAKYSPAGAVLWAKMFGNSFTERYYRIAADDANQRILLAYQNNAVGVAVFQIPQHGGTPTSFGGLSATGGIRPFALTVSQNGDVFYAGDFAGMLSSGQQSVDKISDVFIAKWNTAGVLQWVRSGGGTSDEYAYSVLVDSVGEAYLYGVLSGGGQAETAMFDSTPINSTGRRDGFVVKYSQTGDVLWGTSTTGSMAAGALSAVGDPIVIGNFSGTASFGDLALSGGSPSIFAARLAALPSLQIQQQGNTATLTWQSAAANFIVEGASPNQTPLVWEALGGTVSTVGKINSTVLPMDGQEKLIRLRRSVP